MSQLVGHCPMKQKFPGLIPGQDTCLGFGFVPGWGVYERQPIDVSPPLFLPSFPSLKKINKIFSKIMKKKNNFKKHINTCITVK